MAGAKTGQFKQIISPFLRQKIQESEDKHGANSKEMFALTRQYVRHSLEDNSTTQERSRHYQSVVEIEFEGKPVIGVERLYRRTILIEPSTVCAAHCRWCLRGQYPIQTMNKELITHATRYFGSPENRDDLDEVLITGGDPLMSLPLLAYTISETQRNAPNIKTIRIGTRVPFQAPDRINHDMLDVFSRYPDLRFEFGVNVNHPIEFWPESIEAIKRAQNIGIHIYNQNPLLKGVNDDLKTLIELYQNLRENSIEAHYLFHAIPMRGMSHHRTSLKRGAELAARLSSCGEFSGRSKPRYAVLSDIGKIVIYDGVINDHRPFDNALLLKSGFKLEDRMRWNPGWKMPDSVVLDNDGYMRTWYLDGDDQAPESFAPTMAS